MNKTKLKEKMRNKILKQLKILPFRRPEISTKIINNLKETEVFKKAKTICIYKSRPEEVDTSELIKECEKTKKVCSPVLNNGKMKIHKELATNVEEMIDPEDIDLIIVPGVAFDHQRMRLGRGDGHYDKFLLENKIYSIGLAFIEQIVEEIPIEKNDVRMNLVIFG